MEGQLWTKIDLLKFIATVLASFSAKFGVYFSVYAVAGGQRNILSNLNRWSKGIHRRLIILFIPNISKCIWYY